MTRRCTGSRLTEPWIWLREEYHAVGEAAGIPEPVPVEYRVFHEDLLGSAPGHADEKFQMRWAAGDLLHYAAHPLRLIWELDLPCMSGVDAGGVFAGAGAGQFSA